MEKKLGTISGYASVFNEKDQQNDIVLPGAFHGLDVNKVKLLWQHNSSSPIGKIRHLLEDSYGLYLIADLTEGVSIAKDAYELVKNDAISGLSIGFNPVKYHYDDENNRIIEKLDLWEVSLVTFPANQSACVTDVKCVIFNNVAHLGEEVDKAMKNLLI
jgi:HK97 family phage prohead protease